MTRRGLALVLAPLALVALGSVAPALTVAGLVLAAGALAAVVADRVRAPGGAAITVERDVERLLSVGRPNPVTLRVRAPQWSRLVLRDDAPAAVLVSQRMLRLQGSGAVGYDVTPRARGEATFGRTHVRALGPLGLAIRDSTCADPETVRADADIAAVRVFEALARRGRLEELGMRSLRRRGDGTEFERVREAVPDDPPRRVNWRATARTGRLMATELVPERDQPVVACLDSGRLMGVGAGSLTKFEHAVNAAFLLLHVALRTGDRAGLVTFADRVTTTVPARSGAAQLRRLLDALGPVRPTEIETDHAASLAEVRITQRRRALLAIFTDVVDLDQARALVAQCSLLRRRHLALVVTVRDPAVVDVARSRPRTSEDVYARAVAGGIEEERDAALRLLRAASVDVIDADARTLSPRLVNRYVELKRRAAL